MYTKAENNDVAPDAGVESEVDLLDVQLKVGDSSENKD
jgi:MFS family permease